MIGIVIDIDPVVLRLGPFTVRWFGLTLALALALGLYLWRRAARRLGMTSDDVYGVAFWALAGGIVMSRLFHAFDDLDYFWRHPADLLAIYEGGLSMWGGLIGGLLGSWLYLRRQHLPLAPATDAATLPLLAAQIVGRLGYVINGDAYGRIADLPWAFTYIHPEAMVPMLGVPTHPYPAYEMAWNLVGLALLWRLRGRLRPRGALFLDYALVYSLGRLVLSYTRQNDSLFLGLATDQWVALLVLAAAALCYLRLRCKAAATVATQT